MRILTIVRLVIPITVATVGAIPSLAGEIPFAGTIMDTSFDCLSPCQSLSIMYESPTGMLPAEEIAPYVAWQSLSDAGLPGDWVSFEPSGAGGIWPMPGDYTFKVDYSFKPGVTFDSVKFSILADDFATVSATGFGPLPSTGDAYHIGTTPCSIDPPGCILNDLYQVSLSPSELTAFARDTSLVFTVTQHNPPPSSLQRATPFGLAFNIQATGVIDPAAVPEPNSLGLLVIGIGLSVGLYAAPIWRRHYQRKHGA